MKNYLPLLVYLFAAMSVSVSCTKDITTAESKVAELKYSPYITKVFDYLYGPDNMHPSSHPMKRLMILLVNPGPTTKVIPHWVAGEDTLLPVLIMQLTTRMVLISVCILNHRSLQSRESFM